MDLMGLMKKAKEMQGRVAELQEELENTVVEGVSGGGLVKVSATAKGTVSSLSIDPSLVKPDEVEILEDLVIAAFNDARGKAETIASDKMKEVTGGMGLPDGMKMPF